MVKPVSSQDGMSRRTAVGSLLMAGAGVMLPRCSNPHDRGAVRQFKIEQAIEWQPANLYRDFAFTILQDVALDFVDANCRECGTLIRVFAVAHGVANALAIPCPHCSIGMHVTLIASTVLLSQLKSYAFRKALALLQSDGRYAVHNVAPTTMGGSEVAVARSAIAYDVENHEPVGLFDRQIPAIPRRIFYFNDVRGASGDSIRHVWSCNGRITDSGIRLKIGSDRFRTFSYKQNLASGLWVVTAVASNGDIIDSREFQIA